MERPNFLKLFLNLFLLLLVIVVIFLFATGTIQDKWRSWRQAKNNQNNPPVVMVPATPSPTPASYPPVASPSPTATQYPVATQNLPTTGPELDLAIAGVLGASTSVFYYYSKLKRRYKNATRNIEIL